ncbi:hypothetical protein HanIR_Chr12g0575241 [Helianthus annuus]|nr:hypothetical protein HanIR_Chr12g0575241 [Helianthus annuus]
MQFNDGGSGLWRDESEASTLSSPTFCVISILAQSLQYSETLISHWQHMLSPSAIPMDPTRSKFEDPTKKDPITRFLKHKRLICNPKAENQVGFCGCYTKCWKLSIR